MSASDEQVEVVAHVLREAAREADRVLREWNVGDDMIKEVSACIMALRQPSLGDIILAARPELRLAERKDEPTNEIGAVASS